MLRRGTISRAIFPSKAIGMAIARLRSGCPENRHNLWL
jgi:hypothetical protein